MEWGKKRGIYVGYSTDTTEGEEPSILGPERRYRGDRHLLTIGPNGSGKSRRVLLPNLAELTDWSIVVVDPKGELARMTLQHRKNAGNDVLVLDPFGASGFESDGFNPLTGLDPDHKNEDFVDDAMGLAESMIRIEGQDPHWSASAQDLLSACIMMECITAKLFNEIPSFEKVRANIGKGYSQFRDAIEGMLGTAQNTNHPELAIKASRYANISAESRELNSILSNALTQSRWLDSPLIKADLKKNPGINFGQLKVKPTTVYLVLPARRLATHSVWMRLIITSIIQPLMKDTVKAEVPVLLMLDEYPALAEGDGFPVVSRNMAMFRGYGIKLWTVWQDLNQAQRIYGQHGWETFVANAGVLQSFAPQDVFTAEWLSKRMPLTAMTTEGKSQSFGGSGDKNATPSLGQSENEKGLPLMLPQHLRDMDPGFSILFSHAIKGVGRRFFKWQKPGLESIYDLDPSEG